jgi:hypothetical protein
MSQDTDVPIGSMGWLLRKAARTYFHMDEDASVEAIMTRFVALSTDEMSTAFAYMLGYAKRALEDEKKAEQT